MNEQDRTLPEQPAPAVAAHSGVTNPLADQHHGFLVAEYIKSLQTDAAGTAARWGYTWLHSMSDEEAQAQRENLGFQPHDALDHYNHACLLASREEYAAAAKAFAKALDLKPEFPEAAFNRAMALELGGKAADAREAWKGYLDKQGADLSEEETRLIRDRLTALADA